MATGNNSRLKSHSKEIQDSLNKSSTLNAVEITQKPHKIEQAYGQVDNVSIVGAIIFKSRKLMSEHT